MQYYKSRRTYILETEECFQTVFRPKDIIVTMFITMYPDGRVIIRKGYSWDGVSGPVRDRPGNLMASLLHDALYQLMREGLVPSKLWAVADGEYFKQLKKQGYWTILVIIHMVGLRYAGGKYAQEGSVGKVVFTV